MITQRIPYTSISLTGYVTLVDSTTNILNQRHPNEPFFDKNLQRIAQAKEIVINAIGAQTALSGTKGVKQADRDRDNSFDSMKLHIRAGLRRNNTNYREACERLHSILIKNDLSLAALPYHKESGALVAIFKDLETDQAKTDLATIHATEWLNELKSDQEAFVEAIKDRSEERVEKNAPTDAEALQEIIPAFKSLFKVMDIAEENEIVEDITGTIRLINDSIAEIVLANRRGSLKNDTTEDQ